MPQQPSDQVVITGLGIVSPIGSSESEYWAALCDGRSGAAPIDVLDTSELPRRMGCQVRDFGDGLTAGFHPDSRSGENMGRAARLAVEAGRQALDASGLCASTVADSSPAFTEGEHPPEPQAVSGNRLAVIVGTTMGETEFIEDELSAGADDRQSRSEAGGARWLSPGHASRIVSGRPGSIARHVAQAVSRRIGPSGQLGPPSEPDKAIRPCVDLYGACAAGNMAIEAARRQLLEGRCDVAIAGGADGFSRLAFIGFMRLRVMAAEVCRPFDADRDGLFVGEGAAMFVLERESSARARGAKIRARVLGAGNACENYHPTRPHPDGDGLSRAVAGALADAGIGASDVDYICAHGTGTPQNDAIEVGVMNRMFPAGTPFSSIKALTGHTMGAAAAVEAVACVLMLEHQTLIPTWHLANVLQPCALRAESEGPRPARVRCMLNNSAGFGGYNSSVVIAAA